MKAIKELSEKKKQRILALLEQEGYKKIQDHGREICFQKGLRLYTLRSTDLTDSEDGLLVDFDYNAFMESQYEEKTRHTVSLSDAIEKKGSIEEACDYLGWKIGREQHFNKPNSPWIAELHTDFIYEVKVGDHTHLIVNENDSDANSGVKVYAGTMDALWLMGTEPVEDLLSGSELPALIKEIEQD